MTTKQPNNGTLSLRFLRQLAAPATAFDAFGKDPVYLNVGGRLYEISDFSFVSGPCESHVEIQAGCEVTAREARAAKDRKIIDGYPQEVR